MGAVCFFFWVVTPCILWSHNKKCQSRYTRNARSKWLTCEWYSNSLQSAFLYQIWLSMGSLCFVDFHRLTGFNALLCSTTLAWLYAAWNLNVYQKGPVNVPLCANTINTHHTATDFIILTRSLIMLYVWVQFIHTVCLQIYYLRYCLYTHPHVYLNMCVYSLTSAQAPHHVRHYNIINNFRILMGHYLWRFTLCVCIYLGPECRLFFDRHRISTGIIHFSGLLWVGMVLVYSWWKKSTK